MGDGGVSDIGAQVDELYRTESRRVLATLIRLLGDFDRAEEALQDAFVAALQQWPVDGVPANPVAWLVSTGRFRGLDVLRRRAVHDTKLVAVAAELSESVEPVPLDDRDFADDQLRLVFTCCHPALAPEVQVALTLRTICGLTTEEIARAYLVSPATMAQRIVRAKAKIRSARIPYVVPERREFSTRLDSVLHTIYLVFNEGYSATSGESVTRADLATEAIRLGRLLLDLLDDAEVRGLLGLMLLQDARRLARTDETGDLVLLEDQDRSRWNAAQLAEGQQLIRDALGTGRVGVYTVQGAIAAVHARARVASDTEWAEIVGWYDVLMRVQGGPVIALNRAVAKAMAGELELGLSLVEVLASGELASYAHAHSAHAELLRRVGRWQEAVLAYQRALDLASQEPERRFLTRRILQLEREGRRA